MAKVFPLILQRLNSKPLAQHRGGARVKARQLF